MGGGLAITEFGSSTDKIMGLKTLSETSPTVFLETLLISPRANLSVHGDST